jgi:hypothetical protein
MDKTYWIGRKRAAMAMARAASSAEARLIHYEFAGRCSVMATVDTPFMLPIKGPATQSEREALRPTTPGPDTDYRPPSRPRRRGGIR